MLYLNASGWDSRGRNAAFNGLRSDLASTNFDERMGLLSPDEWARLLVRRADKQGKWGYPIAGAEVGHKSDAALVQSFGTGARAVSERLLVRFRETFWHRVSGRATPRFERVRDSSRNLPFTRQDTASPARALNYPAIQQLRASFWAIIPVIRPDPHKILPRFLMGGEQ